MAKRKLAALIIRIMGGAQKIKSKFLLRMRHNCLDTPIPTYVASSKQSTYSLHFLLLAQTLAMAPFLVRCLLLLLMVLVCMQQMNALLMHICSEQYFNSRRQLVAAAQQSGPTRLRTKHRKNTVRKFWVRPGRSCTWWDNLRSSIVLAKEWKENFRDVKK